MKSVEIVGYGRFGGRKVTAKVTRHDINGLIAEDRDGNTYRFFVKDAGVEFRSAGQKSGWKLAAAYARQLQRDFDDHRQAAEKARERQALRGGMDGTPSRRDRQ